MITWNEETILAQAIASTDGLADEVVVVDTGSTDGTVKLARDLGCRVFTGADRMHKANSRNRAMDEACGDWVVILDADEQIADSAGLREFLENTDAQAVYIRLAFVDGKGNHTLSYQQMRCWQRDAYRYQYRAHEVPVPVDGWGVVEHTEFVWEHRPPADRVWKQQYTLDRLLLDVQENPDMTRPLYYLGRQYMYCQQYENAIQTLMQYLDKQKGHDRADAWRCLALCHGKLGNRNEQIRTLHQACAEHPMRREWWGELAEVYHADGQDEIATGLLRCALEIPQPPIAYTTHQWYGAYIYDLLARCLWKQQRYAEGYEYAKRAVKLEPDDKRLRDNLQWFVDKIAKPAEYYDEVWPQIAANPDSLRRIRTLSQLASEHVTGSLLDLGCGLGEMAHFVNGRRYIGVDFSGYAVQYARQQYPEKHFIQAAIEELPLLGQFDTVVMLEVLEHLDNPAQACQTALDAATRRIIVSVPVNMQDVAHVKPVWERADIEEMLGNLAYCEQVMNGTYWLAIKELA